MIKPFPDYQVRYTKKVQARRKLHGDLVRWSVIVACLAAICWKVGILQ